MSDAPHVRNRIAGERRDAADGATFERRNPADARVVVALAPESTPADVAAAVDAAEKAFPAWAATSPSERAAILRRAAGLLHERADELGARLTAEEGKPVAEARNEARRSGENLHLYATAALSLTGTTFVTDEPGVRVETVTGPVGVVAAITPWNFPLTLSSRKLAPALAAGNTVVFKPSPMTPLSGDALAATFEDAGLPPGVLNVVHGFAAGAHLVADERVAAVTFTGSTAVGARIHAAVGIGRRVQLEMGGKNPVVVLDDADLERAAAVVAASGFSLTGQACTGAGRILVAEAVHDELVERVVALASKHVLGDGMDPATTMGPLVDERALESILAAVDRARAEGATVVCGGERESGGGLGHGWFVGPTIAVDVEPDMELAREEVFGPVIGFERVRDLDEAIHRANDSRYGLASAICTRSLAAAQRFCAEVETGVVKVNRPTVGNAINVPFGGIKQSGTESHKEQFGPSVLDFYTRARTLYVSS